MLKNLSMKKLFLVSRPPEAVGQKAVHRSVDRVHQGHGPGEMDVVGLPVHGALEKVLVSSSNGPIVIHSSIQSFGHFLENQR